MRPIDDILVEEAVFESPFLCDLSQCKGACCTLEGGSGAPLLDEEVARMEAATPAAIEYLDQRSRAILKKRGGHIGTNGNYETICIEERDCVYVYYEGDIAKCALERAFFDGKSSFRKPLSCHLFPIRVVDFGQDYLYYERSDSCRPAIKNGQEQNVQVAGMAREALERAYGPEWYEKFQHIAQQSTAASAHGSKAENANKDKS